MDRPTPERRKMKTAGSGWRPEPETVADRTYRALADLIEARKIQPGQVLEERRWAARLRVSRTPLRTAFNRLEGEGVLVRLSNGLPAVRKVNSDEFLELLHVRKLLEPEATELAVNRIPVDQLEDVQRAVAGVIETATASNETHWLLDDQIHDLIAARCRNASLGGFIKSLRRRARMCNIERIPERLLPACREHLAIVDALIAKDAKGARAAMTTHLENIGAAFLSALVPQPRQE
jgi:DNA-binding GntR family transcriptional regulator